MNAKKQTAKPSAKPIAPIPAPEKKVEGHRLFKLESTPRGKKMFTYTLAIFSVLGGFTKGRKVMKPKDVASFFQTKSVLNHHKGCGNLEETKTGIRLTVSGWNYFHGRLTGSTVAQKVTEPEMKALAVALKTGKLADKTENYPASTKFVENIL